MILATCSTSQDVHVEPNLLLTRCVRHVSMVLFPIKCGGVSIRDAGATRQERSSDGLNNMI